MVGNPLSLLEEIDVRRAVRERLRERLRIPASDVSEDRETLGTNEEIFW